MLGGNSQEMDSDSTIQAELEELEERNRGLQMELDRIALAEQEARTQRDSVEKNSEALRQELAAARSRLERAAQIRNTCKRLSCLEGKLGPMWGAKREGVRTKSGSIALRPVSFAQVLGHVVAICLAVIAGTFASLLAYTYMQGDPEKICRPPPVTGAQCYVCTQPFEPNHPPLMREGQKLVNQSQLVMWGEAALHVCSKGTSEQSFLRRDDCDGCLCPSGSLWMHYKDPRFFGDGEYCVPEKQWKDCIARWSCCKNRPNYCWDFIFDGARQDPKSEDYCVVVDTCSQHMACYSMIRRQRRWELISELRPTSGVQHRQEIAVGVPLVQIEHVNKTLNMNPDIRGWGMPSSVLQLIKVTPTTAPQEWQQEQLVQVERTLAGGKHHKIWQLVSYFTIIAKGMSGEEFTMTEFAQREYTTFCDSK